MNKIAAWFKSHNITSHTFVGLAVSAGGLYFSVPELKAMVDGFVAAHHKYSAVFALAIAIYAKYSHGHNPNE